MSALRDRVVAEALDWVGTPYRHQASLKGVGCDCLGLVRGVWRAVHGREPIAVPAYSPDWAEATGEDRLTEAARRFLIERAPTAMAPGDVLLFRYRPGLPAKHAAILVAPDRFVHAHEGAAVCGATLSPWWRRRIAGVFAWPEPLGPTP